MRGSLVCDKAYVAHQYPNRRGINTHEFEAGNALLAGLKKKKPFKMIPVGIYKKKAYRIGNQRMRNE